MNFLEMTTNEAKGLLREKKYMHNIPKESVIHICRIPNERYVSCDRYIVKCSDGVVEFLATQHHGVCVDEFIDIIRVLYSEDGKDKIVSEIQRIKKQTEQRIEQELAILNYL